MRADQASKIQSARTFAPVTNFAAKRFGTQIKSNLVEARCSFENYYYMKKMQLEMRTFLGSQSFDSFSHHKELN